MKLTEKTLIVVTNECPYPAIHGGRVDQWSRYSLLKRQGWTLILITWVAGSIKDLPEHDLETLKSVFSEVIAYSSGLTIAGVYRRLRHLPQHSPHVSSRRISDHDLMGLIKRVEGSGAQAVVLDGLYGALLALDLAKRLDLPLIYRSHNIEHLYMQGQARAQRGWKARFALWLASLHLKPVEIDVRERAAMVWDISSDDLNFWVNKGHGKYHWLPPLVDASRMASVRTSVWSERPYDVVYLGNLRTPNNVSGLIWFIDEVWPLLRVRAPDIKVLIAGSDMSERLSNALRHCPEIDLVLDPADAWDVRAQGRVLINPVRSGSGMNIKSVEMLFSDSAIVATSQALRGFREDQKAYFHCADTAEGFADAITVGLQNGPVKMDVRRDIRAFFTSDSETALTTGLLHVLEKCLPDDRTGALATGSGVDDGR